MLPYGYSHYNALQRELPKRLTHRIHSRFPTPGQSRLMTGRPQLFGDTSANTVPACHNFATRSQDVPFPISMSRKPSCSTICLCCRMCPSSFLGPRRWVFDGWQYSGIFTRRRHAITPQISGDPMGLRSSDTFGFPNFNYGIGCNPVNKENKVHYINLALLFLSRRDLPLIIPSWALRDAIPSLAPDCRITICRWSRTMAFPAWARALMSSSAPRSSTFSITATTNNPLKAGTQLFQAAPAPTSFEPGACACGQPSHSPLLRFYFGCT